MKYITSEKVNDKKWRVTLEVTEQDLNLVEKLHHTLDPYVTYHKFKRIMRGKYSIEKYQKWTARICELDDAVRMTPKYERFINKLWHNLWIGTWHKKEEPIKKK